MLRFNLQLATAASLVSLLVACGGGGSSAPAAPAVPAATTAASITPFKGPFYPGATVVIKDANGNPVVLTSGGTIDANGLASATFATSVTYPLIVEVTGSYYNEMTKAAETTTVPMRGLILNAAEAAAGVPVTIVTEAAVTDLQNRLGGFALAHPITSSLAQAALTAAGNIFGVPARAIPVFNATAHTSADANSLRLAAWSIAANSQAGATMADKVKALAASFVNPATVPANIVSQASYNAALVAVTSGASSVMAAGAIAPTPPTVPTISYGAIYAGTPPSGGTPAAVLNPPGVVAAIDTSSGTTGQLTVSWTAVIGATGYNVYASPSAGVSVPAVAPTVKLNATPLTTTSYPHAFAAGSPVFFKVTALNTVGESAGSIEVNATPVVTPIVYGSAFPAAPISFTATTASSTAVDLSWSPVSGTMTYVVLRSTSPNIARSQTTILTTTNTPSVRHIANPATTYYYRVYACETTQSCGADSVEISATTSATVITTAPATAPTGIIATAYSGSTIGLVWTGVTGATGYNIYRASSQGGASTKVTASPTSLGVYTYTDTGLTGSTPYYYTITAVNSIGEGIASASVTATTNRYYGPGSQVGGAIQGTPLTLSGTVSTFAGSALTPENMVGVTSDGANLYTVTSFNNNFDRIFKTVLATGKTTIFANFPGATLSGITTDGINLYVMDAGASIRQIPISAPTTSTMLVAATVNDLLPRSVTIDSTHTNLYVSKVNNYANATISKVVISTGATSTLAGGPANYTMPDGTGNAATFNQPKGIAIDSTDTNLYVVEANAVRKVEIATGIVTTLAGKVGMGSTSPTAIGAVDGTGTVASFNQPNGIAIDSTNSYLYVADTRNNTIRQIAIGTGAPSTGVVTTLAGTASFIPGQADGTGNAASFGAPNAIAVVGGNLYVASGGGLRKIVPNSGIANSAVVSTLLGGSQLFTNPSGITSDGVNLYVISGNLINKINIATGVITPLAGSLTLGSTNGIGAAASFNSPSSITTDGTNLFVSDAGNNVIRQIVISTGEVTALAGTVSQFGGNANGTGATAAFNLGAGGVGVAAITTDGTNVYLADKGNALVRQIVISSGVVTTLAGSGAAGYNNGTGIAASFTTAGGITTDGTNVYLTDRDYGVIRKIVIATGVVTSHPGLPNTTWMVDAYAAIVASITGGSSSRNPSGITTDGTHLFMLDSASGAIRKIVIGTGVETTLAGTPDWTTSGTNNFGYVDGVGTAAKFSGLHSITTDGISLYATETGNKIVRKIQ